jgi:hypothetical protein
MRSNPVALHQVLSRKLERRLIAECFENAAGTAKSGPDTRPELGG